MSEQTISPRLKIGDPAPSVKVLSASGQPVALSDLWRERPRLFAFLRHFG